MAVISLMTPENINLYFPHSKNNSYVGKIANIPILKRMVFIFIVKLAFPNNHEQISTASRAFNSLS